MTCAEHCLVVKSSVDYRRVKLRRDLMPNKWFSTPSGIYRLIIILEYISRALGDGRFLAEAVPKLIECSWRLPVVVEVELKFAGLDEASTAWSGLPSADTPSRDVGPFDKLASFEHRFCG